MNDGKSTLSKAQTYHGIGTFWDTHDLSDAWEQTEPVSFKVAGASQTTYYPVEVALSEQLRKTAARRGISPETLLNLWLQEQMAREIAAARSS